MRPTEVAARVVLLGDADRARRPRRSSSSCSNGRSRRPRTTASSCATPPRSAPSAAAASSTCARPRASAARRSASRSSTRTRSPTRTPRSPRCSTARRGTSTSRPSRATARSRRRRSTRWSSDGLVDPHRRHDARPLARRLAAAQARARSRRSRPSTRTTPTSPASASSGCACSSSRACRRRPSPRCCRRWRAPHEVALDGAWVRLPGHEVRLTPADEKLWNRIRPLLGAAERFRPPRVRDIAGALGAAEADVRRLLKLLGRMGQVDEVAHDHFFLRDTVAEMVEIAADVAAQADERPVHRGAVPRPARQRPQGRDPDPRILRPPRRDLAARRPAPHQPASSRSLPPSGGGDATDSGREASPVGRPDFKSGRGRETVLGGFDSHSLPPHTRSA